jgi:subfamily B ATP-binding cassette protein MsbA
MQVTQEEKNMNHKTKKKNLATIKNFLPFMKPYWGKCTIAGLLSLISAVVELAAPIVLLLLIDKIIPQRNSRLLTLFGIGFIGLYFVRSFVDFARGRMLIVFRENVVRDIQKTVYAHAQELPLMAFDEKKTGYLTSRVLTDSTATSSLMGDTIISIFINALIVIGTVIIVLLMNWRLSLIAVSIVPLFALGIYFFNSYIKDASHRVQEERSKIYGDIQESFAGIRVIKSFGLERQRSTEVENCIENNRSLNVKLGTLTALSTAVVLMFTTLAGVCILWFGSFQVLEGLLTIGQLMAFSAYTVNIYGPIRNLMNMNSNIQISLAAAERLLDLLNEPIGVHEKPDARDIVLRGGVAFRDVSFAYPNGVQALKGISFKIQPGTMVAIVGESGAGKSTLISLLARFFDSFQGTISLDEVDIREIRLESLIEQFGIVLQDTFLFSTTILENIRIGRLYATEENVIEAAKTANAHQFIIDLPQGYQTQVGERGAKLSGGEKQRISIARAILRDPTVLILDEATSSVDSTSENLIRDALDHLSKNRTTFVIAHRFSTVLSAQTILVLHKGALVGIGTHHDLYENNEIYRKLYSEQFGALGRANFVSAEEAGVSRIIVQKREGDRTIITVHV